MASDQERIVNAGDFEVTFILNPETDQDAVENVDAFVTTSDGVKCSITFMTLIEVGRVMNRWAGSGECLNGAYFQCVDLIITREPGISVMVDSLRDIYRDYGRFSGILPRV